MSKQNNKANNALQHKRQQQDTKFQPQMKIVFEAFKKQPKTILNLTWPRRYLKPKLGLKLSP